MNSTVILLQHFSIDLNANFSQINRIKKGTATRWQNQTQMALIDMNDTYKSIRIYKFLYAITYRL
ncbi:hypothetical protein SAMN05444395_10963 [Flavobacterium fryxellicola]|nr:hypothetical protein SAMN05444395_10963 [Flavobacterium fryxellicola]